MSGFTHLVASRDGLFLVNRKNFCLVAPGLYFGLAVYDNYVVVFEAGDRPWVENKLGRIVRFTLKDGAPVEPQVVVEGLDNGCHQIDAFDNAFFVVDTYNQQVLEFDADWTLVKAHQPIPPARYGAWDQGYVHMNSLVARGDSIFLLLHRGGKGRPSEVLEVDRRFVEKRRFTLPGQQCHDLAPRENGGWLICDSAHGRLISAEGPVVQIDALYTRGLSVGADEIAVGSSLFGARGHRELIPGFVTFLDRSYQRVARLHLPAAPTQIRSLDGHNRSRSGA
jgi:hypothetical protein